MIYLIIRAVILLVIIYSIKKAKAFTEASPSIIKNYKDILLKEVEYYEDLPDDEKEQFEKRVDLFIQTKKITGVDVIVDEQTKVLVAASAVIPAFAFDDYNYP